MKNSAQAVIAYATWESGETPTPYYDNCIITLYNMTTADIIDPEISFVLADNQQPSQNRNFIYTQDGNTISGTLTDQNTIPANEGSVSFAIGINGGDPLGPLPSHFIINGASADIPADSQAPSIPQNVTVINTGAKNASLTWAASTDDTLVVGYLIEYSDGKNPQEISVDTTSGTITGLTESTQFTASIKSVDIAGNQSDASATVSFTTQDPVPDAGEYSFSVAPYIDYMAWPQLTTGACYDASGIKNYTLAFIVTGKNSVDGSLMPSWGGQSEPQYDARTSSIALDDISTLRANGGDVAISFGGAAGVILEQSVEDIGTLISWYQQIIDNYALKHIDFDFEGSALAQTAALSRHVVVIEAIMRANPALQVSYTLPVGGQTDPASQGLSSYGLDFINMLTNEGILPSMVNGMTMDFGQGAPADMFTGVKYALDALNSQVVQTWPQLTIEQAWRRMGATPMFGDNDVQGQTFTTANQSQLLDYAQQVNLGMLSGWSENRDHDLFAWAYSLLITGYLNAR